MPQEEIENNNIEEGEDVLEENVESTDESEDDIQEDDNIQTPESSKSSSDTLMSVERPPQKKNPGSPIGVIYNETNEKKKVAAAFRKRILKSADKLFNAQFGAAIGLSHLFKVDRVGEDQKRKHVLVTDPEEIKRFLDGEVDPKDYYYIATKDPDLRAIDSLLDRGLGRPTQGIELGGDVNVNTYEGCTKSQLEKLIRGVEFIEKSGVLDRLGEGEEAPVPSTSEESKGEGA